jgi:di/tricarboxylate transporter
MTLNGTFHEWILIAVIIGALLLILSNRLRADLVALLVLIVLGFSGVVTPQEAISGFSRPAIITIISLFIISAGLENTGVIQWVANRFREIGRGSEARLITLFMGAGALLSLVMNNIAAGAMLLPAAIQVARDSNVRASKLLMPLSFGTLVGGMATYFTTANIVMSGLLQDQGLPGLTMLDFLPTGGLVVLVTLIFMATIGRRLLPARESVGQIASPYALSRSLEDTYRLKERMWEVRVPKRSRLAGCVLSQSRIGEQLGITVLAIWRGQQAILTPEPNETLQPDDMLLLLGREDRVKQLEDWGAIVGRENGATRSTDYAVDLTEVIIPPRSSVIGKTLRDLRFRNKYNLTSVALWREGRSYRTDVSTFPLQEGDALLMVGPVKSIHTLAQDRDFLVLQSSHIAQPPERQKALRAVLITFVVLLVSILEVLPIPEVMLAGAVMMILTGCLTMDEAYAAIEWKVIFLIAGMTPISIALVNTGYGAEVGQSLVNVLQPFGTLTLLAGLFALTVLIAQVMGGQVAALVAGPIVISAALAMGIDPQAAAVAAAIGCSTAFLLPTAHPVNVLMMGPGGYKPSDFTRVGVAMTILTFVMMLAGMRLFWGI